MMLRHAVRLGIIRRISLNSTSARDVVYTCSLHIAPLASHGATYLLSCATRIRSSLLLAVPTLSCKCNRRPSRLNGCPLGVDHALLNMSTSHCAF
ncbi:hypothetical protein BD413DRAFT_563859 [Trametes elegans]|nr:hypothetical protein BD413DRAFT_563859 [Trametes elegans]